ncbi:hypothetical protein CIT26_17255 [Mesorhizobium temperatum]|uniref:Uncharacterized protein n=2 Tax=Mesorhizobium temperatum TaxID=241416 RepID=A0A271LMT5_9HYPH|nr:hypothetical protein CIT26_17255 [Mesorhizobium temperatum]
MPEERIPGPSQFEHQRMAFIAIACSMYIDLVPGAEFKRTIDRLTCAEALAYAEGLSQIAGRLLFSIGFTLQSADARVPRRPTRKDRAAVQAVVTEMAQLKRELEGMLQHLEDWAESRVALTATAAHTPPSPPAQARA